MKPEALIFDFDGLIVDTEVPIFEAWQADYARFGQELKLSDYVGCVGSDERGFDPKVDLENLTGETIEWAELDEERWRWANEKVNELGPLPGVVDLLDEAEAAGIPAAVASSSPADWIEPHLARIGLRDRFSVVRCRDDVSAPKPSPELFLSAAEGLGVAPERAVVFEDSLNGLRAAQSAGMRCVIVPNPITAALDFSGAARKVASLADVSISFLAEIFTEPMG